jgi:Tfp pilus assembly protein PilF
MRRLMLLLLVLLSGCAATQPHPDAPAALFADTVFKPPAQPVDAHDLFAVSPAMRDYLHSPAFAAHLHAKGLERGLLEALYSQSDLKLDYNADETRSAAGTYAARAGNCLSLVIMTAAFARELGMTVRFQSVMADETWSRDSGLVLVASHVNIVLGHHPAGGMLYDGGANRELVVDFLPPPEVSRFRTRQLEEEDIVALFLNNRAAESLVAGRIDDAYWWARAAVSAYPAAAIAYNTLAVVYQRHGNLDLAERAYRAALAREPESATVMNNLAPLLAQTGRTAEAQAMARRAASIQPAVPFEYFDKGMRALAEGSYEDARRLFEREIARAPYADENHFWLAVTLLRLGEARQARDELAIAIDTSTRTNNRKLYAAKLAHLRRQSADATGKFD